MLARMSARMSVSVSWNAAFTVRAGDPDSKTSNARAKRWIFDGRRRCAGRWIREVCNVAAGDLPWIVAAPQMFVFAKRPVFA